MFKTPVDRSKIMISRGRTEACFIPLWQKIQETVKIGLGSGQNSTKVTNKTNPINLEKTEIAKQSIIL